MPTPFDALPAGIDIAHFQDEGSHHVDWPTVSATGCQWVSLKVSQGDTYLDPWGARHRAATDFARWKLLYHYLSFVGDPRRGGVLAAADPVAQARWYLKVIGTLQPREGVMLDIEAFGVDYHAEAEAAATWCDVVEQATQRPVALYGVTDAWADPRLNNGQRPLILASWTTDPASRLASIQARTYLGHHVAGWQFTGSGAYPGVTGLVDRDVVLDTAAFDRCCGIVAPPPPAGPPRLPLPPPGQPLPVLRIGAHGAVVEHLQQRLNAHGAHLADDGIFGPVTRTAVRRFQAGARIVVDGVVGKVTWKALG